MYKKFTILLLILSLLLCGCGGNVKQVRKYIGESDIFTTAEINSAMNAVISKFKQDFDDCTLMDIHYDEAQFQKAAEEWAQQYDADEAIVLTSSFQVGPSGGDGSLNPNSTYNNWQWILTRNGKSPWKLQTWGYG